MPFRENLDPRTIVAERYVVQKKLATGGFGAVYQAEQLATERKVALKVLFPHLLDNEKVRQQFALEARVASRVKSDHVVQVLDAGTDARLGVTYLVMELLEGRDLEQLVQEDGPPAPELALEYLRQTAAGLEKAHRYVDRQGRPAPIIHRDLKPSNLFLTEREDGSPLIKILDFGIAKVLSATTQVSGEVKGTPLFMAYEQAAHGAIGPSTDIWAFGLIAFFLLTGRNYWRSANSEEGTMTQLFAEVLTLPFAPASVRASEIGLRTSFGAGFDAWFARCLDRDPTQRFQSVSEAYDALVSASVARPAHALSPTLLEAGAVAGRTPLGAPATVAAASAAAGTSGDGPSANARRAASPLAEVETLAAISNPRWADSPSRARGLRGLRGVAITGFVLAVLAAGAWSMHLRAGEGARSNAERSASAEPPAKPEASPPLSQSAGVLPAPPGSSAGSAPAAVSAAPREVRAAPTKPARKPAAPRRSAGKTSDDLYGER